MEGKPATIYDLAKAAGVSVGTVNRAIHNKPRINPKTREHVLNIAKEINFQANHIAQSLGGKKIRIGVALYSSVHDFLWEIEKGMNLALSELRAFNVEGEIRIVFGDPVDGEIETRTNIHEYIDKNYDGILLDGIVLNSLRGDQKYKDRTQPVCSVINKQDGANLFVTGDGICSGALAAQMMGLTCPGKKVAVFVGDRGYQIHDHNLTGFMEFAKNQSFKGIYLYEHQDDIRKAIELTDRLIDEHPDIAGIYVTSAISPVVCRRLFELGYAHKLQIITTDLFSETREFLAQGLVTATIFQNPFQIGYEAISNLYKMICGLPVEKHRVIVPQLVMKANMNQY